MFRPQKVYVDRKNPEELAFDKFTDIQPLQNSKMNPGSQKPLDSQAESMELSVKGSFDGPQFLSNFYSDKKTLGKALQVVSHIQKNVDPGVLRFGSRGGIFYKGNLVPDANLCNILKSLLTKKGLTMERGEFYLLETLSTAPPAIAHLISPAKLKLCHTQTKFVKTGELVSPQVPPSKPQKVFLPPNTNHNTQVEIRTPNPFTFKPHIRKPPTVITKMPSTKLNRPNPPTKLQKRFNVKQVPQAWYKVL